MSNKEDKMEKIFMLLNLVLGFIKEQLKRDDEEFGIVETEQALKAINSIGIVAVELFSDGVSFSDAIDFYNKIIVDEKMKKVITDAYDNFEKIPNEVRNIGISEGASLAQTQLSYIPMFIEKLKKS